MRIPKVLFFLFVTGLGGVLSWYGYQMSRQPLSSILFFGGFLVMFAGVIGIFITAADRK
ncbi:hypothetical protein [Pontibacter chitinilyticus]|uniref:hypothetical protein n=1 Tax=Pontibacter chitinilyticus TaxID=2674989 RepID=UPI00321AD1EB